MNDSRWDPRRKKMSLDFQNQNLYQHDIDQPFIQDHQHPHFDQMDPADQPSYIFNEPRYRTNASSSSSLGHGFPDPLYNHASFEPPFPPTNYDMMVNSGKVSPLTPNDSVTNLHHGQGFPSKDYPHQPFNDMHESRRLPGVNSGYHTDYPDDYPINGLPFNSGAMHHFQDRLGGRFPPDRYTHTNGPPSGMSPSPTAPSRTDFMRGVAPQATHSFRDHPVSPYDDMHYLGNNSHPDMRTHTLDETLVRMKLQVNPLMGSSSDLQTFIRSVLVSCFNSSLSHTLALQPISRSVRQDAQQARVRRAHSHRHVQQGCAKVLRHGETVRTISPPTLIYVFLLGR